MSKNSNIKPICDFKAHATEVLSELRRNADSTVNDRMIEAIELLTLVQHGEEDLRMKRTMSPEQVRTRLVGERARREKHRS
jgi:hypothetical protein